MSTRIKHMEAPADDSTMDGDAILVSEPRRTWVHKSATAVMLDVDPHIGELLGWDPSDLIGQTSLDFIHPDDQTSAVENWMQMLASPNTSLPLKLRHRHRDGSWIWVVITNRNTLDDPSHSCVVAEIVEVPAESIPAEELLHTERPEMGSEPRPLQMHEALRAREQVLHRLAEALPVGVLHVDAEGRVLYANRRLHIILDKERCPTFGEQLSTVLAEDTVKVTDAFESALAGGLDVDIDIRVRTSEETAAKAIRQCTLSIRTLSSEDGQIVGAVASLADITESVRMRDELRLQASFDTLTTCYNRATTMAALDKMLAEAPDHRGPAVIFVDLDDFKGINDHLGHGAGDDMLEIVARRLHRSIRGGDVVGRIGGDEFLVLCPGVGSRGEALRAATRVSNRLRGAVKLGEAEVSCRASVGVAWSGESGLRADTLIGQADAAMYEAKRSGLAGPVLFGHTA